MRRSILPNQTSTINAKNYMIAWQGDVVDKLIVSALQEGRVDDTKRDHPLTRHPSAKGNRMRLSNAHIIASLRESLHHHIQRTARRHSWRYSHNPLVFGSQLGDRRPKDLLKLRWVRASLALDAFSRLNVKASRGVPYGRVLLCRFVPFALDRPEV